MWALFESGKIQIYARLLDSGRRYHTSAAHPCVDVIMEGKTVKGVIVENKSGRGAILADRIVDATGDGDVAALAGAAYEKGENNNGKVLPVTMVFGVSGVDTKPSVIISKATRR